MADPLWQELLRQRLTERNANESAYASIIEQCTLISISIYLVALSLTRS